MSQRQELIKELEDFLALKGRSNPLSSVAEFKKSELADFILSREREQIARVVEPLKNAPKVSWCGTGSVVENGTEMSADDVIADILIKSGAFSIGELIRCYKKYQVEFESEPSKDNGQTLEDNINDAICAMMPENLRAKTIIHLVRSHDQKDKLAISRKVAANWLKNEDNALQMSRGIRPMADEVRKALENK